MKNIILLLCFALGFKTAIADCSSKGIKFFPNQKEIGLNAMFIIQGYASSQKTINSFKNQKVYLQSDNGELIALNLLEILKGQMSLTQAIFKPSQSLKPNTRYFLKYTNLTGGETIAVRQYNPENKKREKAYWKTTYKDLVLPTNTNLEILLKRTRIDYFGCGPSVNAIFNIDNTSKSEIWYKTEVVEIETNTKTLFYLKAKNNSILVGHNMCSGAFIFKNKGKYKVRFTAMNTDGKILKTTQWTSFKSPYMNNKKRFK